MSAEDGVACILLDFIGMMGGSLRLVQWKAVTSISNADLTMEEGGHTSQPQTQLQTNETISLMPNILDSLGEELLLATLRTLSFDACSSASGYNHWLQSMRFTMEIVDKDVSVLDVVKRHLSPFYRSHVSRDDGTTMNETERGEGGADTSEEFLSSPLRTGEWRKYYSLYYPGTIEIENSKPHTSKVNTENSKKDDVSVSYPRHPMAFARYFLEKRGLDSLEMLLSIGTDVRGAIGIDRLKRASIENAEHAISIYRTIAFLSIFSSQPHDILHSTNQMTSFERFRLMLSKFFQCSPPNDCRVIPNMLSFLEDRSLTDDEWTVNSPKSVLADLKMTDAISLKHFVLWKYLTGRDLRKPLSALSAMPSLQCQIQALNEYTAWLLCLENDLRERKRQYEVALDMEISIAEESKINTMDVDEKAKKRQDQLAEP